jgi:spore coat polysaccharide biosynthesis protein SpsF (cytidylyltransferase family)
MRVVALVQARVGSSRLPEKVLADLAGIPMLSQVVRRLKLARRLDDIVVATSDSPGDDRVVEVAQTEDVGWYRGDEQDVLRRMLGAARESRAEVIVRVTGDCPLLDPWVLDAVVDELLSGGEPCDYASNVLRRTFPRGLDSEALFGDVLERVERLAASPEAREHVTWLIREERPELFIRRSVEWHEDHSELDWSVDTEDDLARIRQIYARFGLDRAVTPWSEVALALRAASDSV